MKRERIIWLDILKILAIFSVVILHAASFPIIERQHLTEIWHIANIYDSLVRFCVPVLVMISGVLFLNDKKEVDVKKLYKKNILRLFTTYITWNIIYSLYNVYINNLSISYLNMPFIAADHLWFIPMIIGLYIITPILRQITKDKKSVEYLLIIFFIFGIILPFISGIATDYFKSLSNFIGGFQLELCSYVGYFILGHYIYTYKPFRDDKIIYIVGYISAFIICIAGTIMLSSLANETRTLLYTNFSIPTFIEAVSLFCLFQYTIGKKKFSTKASSIISKLSYYTFGIYLVHLLVLYSLRELGFDVYSMNGIVSIPLLSIVAFITSLVIVYIISKIPFINRYLI